MTAHTAVQHTLDVQYVPIELIDPNPANIRSDLGDLTSLTESIRRHGVQQPGLAYRSGDRYTLISAHRRHGAALKAGLTEFPLALRDEPDEAALIELMFDENVQRSSLDPIDEGLALKRLRQAGHYRSVEPLAQAVHRSKDWVAGRIALTELPEACWEPVRAGEVSIADAIDLARADLSDDTKVQLVAVDADDRARRIRVAIDDQRRVAERARIAEEYGDLITGADFYTFSRQQPWGLVELGDHPGQLNVPVAMHRGSCQGHAASIDWDGKPHAWCSRPLDHTDELDLEVPAKAQPLKSIGLDGYPHAAAHEQHCPHHRNIKVGDHVVEVCIDPTMHTNPKRKGYQSADDLAAAWKAQQGDRRPGEPLRSEARWTIPTEVLDLITTRLREALTPLPQFVTQAMCVGWGVESELAEIVEQLDDGQDPAAEYLATQLAEDIRREIYGWSHSLEHRDADDLITIDLVQWALQCCVDVGAPPPNLDQIRTRIEVLSKGDVDDAEGAGDA